MAPTDRHILAGSIAVLAVLLAGAPEARSASATWSGATSDLWSTGANWSATTVPGTTDTATFNSASANTTISLGAGVTIKTLLYDTSSAAAYILGSGGDGAQTLTLDNSGAITINSSVTTNQTINANLVLGNDGATSSFAITNSSATANHTLTLAGAISGSSGSGVKTLTIGGVGRTTVSGLISHGSGGSLRLTKTGTGILTLSGANTFTGKTTLSGGTLSINSFGNVGAASSALGAPTSVANGTIDFTASSTLTYTGPATSSDRVLKLAGGGATFTHSGTGLVTLTGGITGTNNSMLFRGLGDITEAGLVAHSGSVSRTDPGTLYLTNPGNSFPGNLLVFNGTISVSSVANSGSNSAAGSGSTIFLGQNGAGSVGQGTLQFTGTSGGGTNRSLVIQNGAAGGIGVIENTVAGQTLTLSGNLTANDTSSASSFILQGAGNGSFNGSITGSPNLALTKSGAGTWSLGAANTHTGSTTLSGGTLALGHVNALQNSTLDTGTTGAQTVAFAVAGTNTYNLGGLTGSDDLDLGANTLSVGANNASTSNPFARSAATSA